MTEETILLRQVHPSFVQANNISTQVFITSQTFKPTPKDNGKLSIYNGEKFTAETAFTHFIDAGHKSAGVLGVTPNECQSVSNVLTCHEDNDPFDGHGYIDYNSLDSNNAIEKAAKKLKAAAIARGWLYLSEKEES